MPDSDGDVWRYLPLGPLPTVVVALVGLGLLLMVGMRASRGTQRLAVALLVLTTFAIFAVTLGTGSTSPGPAVNLHPGAGIRSELDNVNQALGAVNILGNILVFVPLGWLIAVLALYAPSTGLLLGLRRAALAGLVLSLTIEVLQSFIGRAADIDDVFLNTAGTVFGAITGAALSAARRRRRPEATPGEETQLALRAESRTLPS